MNLRHLSRRRGFSLIETSLAVGVVGIGILGVVGLFPAGLEMNRRAMHDTYASLFAAQVMDGIRAEFRRNPDMSPSRLAAFSLPLALERQGASDADGNPVAALTPTTTPTLIAFHHPSEPAAEDFVLWYRFELLPALRVVGGETTFWEEGQRDTTEATRHVYSEMPIPNMVRVRLLVWSGRRVDMTDRDEVSASSDRLQEIKGTVSRHRYIYRNHNVRYFYTEIFGYD